MYSVINSKTYSLSPLENGTKVLHTKFIPLCRNALKKKKKPFQKIIIQGSIITYKCLCILKLTHRRRG